MTAVLDNSGYAPTAYRSNRKASGPAEPTQQSALFRKSWTMVQSKGTGRCWITALTILVHVIIMGRLPIAPMQYLRRKINGRN
ncbi:hypothetical protein [Marinobacter sp. LV10R510-11A]|uniref:hypothetical protein n=1 Tax=Marinobacter sp. LV10R510-11A TaxID=1415568 RepID=UPI0012FDC142|nr:hypothetical protein [Marinobacter sp. LV10R510-11A]